MSGLGLGVQALKLAPREQAQRFAVAIIASVIAVTFILPIGGMHHAAHTREAYIRVALIPAAAAWFVLWRAPGGHGIAMFRTAMMAIAFVGLGGFVLRFLSTYASAWIVETVHSAQFIPQAAAYVIIGLTGVAASALFEREE